MFNGVQKEVGRQGMLVIGGLAAIGLFMAYLGYSWISRESASPTRLSPVTEATGTAIEESNRYRNTLHAYNKKEAESATKSGETYLSVMSSKQTPVVQEEKEEESEVPSSLVQTTPIYAPHDQPSRSVMMNEKQMELLQEQMKTLLIAWAPVAHGTARSSDDGAQVMNAMMTSSAAQAPTDRQAPPQVIVEPYSLLPAILVTGIDTDENSVVSAYVTSGPYAGAELFAMGYKRLNTTVDMTFTSMQWKRRAYKITAKPMDLDTGRTTLSGQVNNRYFERIILPAIASGIGNTGQLFARANSQTVITPQGGAVQSFQTPSSGEIAGGFASGMGIQAGQVLANDAANIPQKQVIVPAKTTIGIRFIGPVLSTDEIAAGAMTPGNTGAANVLAQGIEATSKPASMPNLQRIQTFQPRPAVGIPTTPAITYPAIPQPFVETD
jgi:intracellular multiplication protein IcmE